MIALAQRCQPLRRGVVTRRAGATGGEDQWKAVQFNTAASRATNVRQLQLI